MKSPSKKGIEVLRDKTIYRSIAFTRKEREKLGLTGLLPYVVASQQELVQRVMEALRRLPRDIDRYMALSSLQERNERLFYQVTLEHVAEIMPLIYTPTVGEACREYSHIAKEPKGFFITPKDKGRIRKMLDNWPEKDIRVIVVTDGQRILGLGDLGANGIGIPIGKLALYTVCAGIPPEQCLPLCSTGTNNEEFLDDVLYVGYPKRRITGTHTSRFSTSLCRSRKVKISPCADPIRRFSDAECIRALKKYRNRVLCFNDDIQGTAAVALAGVLASLRITGLKFSDLRIMFLGAGSAATGIADLMVTALGEEGMTEKEARQHLFFVDVNGLVVAGRRDLMDHNMPYAHDGRQMGFVEAIDEIKPHVLIGATGAAGTFTQEVVEHMSAANDRPVIFALSNPTANAECTAADAYSWSNGKAVFASGSPFGEVIIGGTTFVPSQANNAYVFPGIGLGAVISRARTIPDEFFLGAARTLSGLVSEGDLRRGSLFPPLAEMRKISFAIAERICRQAYALGLARNRRPKNLKLAIKKYMYDPSRTVRK
jgi:malate dehydrogenase (oxaloacetate-decarboxylating)(NADP+)